MTQPYPSKMTVDLPGWLTLADVPSNRLPRYDAYRSVVDKVRARVDNTLPAPNQYSVETTTKAQRNLGITWRNNVRPLLDTIEPVFTTMFRALQAIQLDTTRNAEFQRDSRRNAINAATAELSTISDAIVAAAAALMTKAQKLALPQRPDPQDALQEARLAGLKGDLHMLTSSVNTLSDIGRQEFLDRLTSRLTAAIADDDKLATWLICSEWPMAILAPAVGFGDIDLTALRASWPHTLAETLSGGSPEAESALTIANSIGDPIDGLPALEVATGWFLAGVVEDLADWLAQQPNRS